ncbi:conserved hypothetical protein [Theileria orientalis strain Shintoku]|uniref:Uncharacterized protein n=1 Tax=Theileria orientalis strain Shintoku TaxID=869250 RepID=J4CDQ4_THEOR|nr:conserved hypothetical protein [Theileria orientalis strain Shintoku]BAM41547.1 conserved hypothetical protein [Theileria orientalis strain Shintoku]|eukprot:XP_009691848.1 conserved hypothetical protein [Theileria orientalis strain Shintoku]
MSGRLISITRTLRSSLTTNNWHNLGKFATGGNAQQEIHWNSLKANDSNVTNVIENTKKELETLDWAKWEERISHKNILSHMKSTYTSTMKTLDRALSDKGEPPYLKEGWETYEEVKQVCSEATKAADKIISDGIKALWISQHNPPTWKVDTNEWLESDQYWQAFVEKHAMYSQSGTSNDPESPSEIEAVKNKWNLNMFKFNERTDTPMLYDYMHHNPSWEYYDINRKQFFEHMEYFLLRTGEDFRNFPDVPKWKWLTHIEDMRFKQFTVEMSRKHKKQIEKLSRYEKTDLGPEEHESEEEVNMQLLLGEKNDTEKVLARLLGGYGFLVDPLVPIQNLFQLSYVLSKDNYSAHKKTKVYSLGDDVPYLYVLPHGDGVSEVADRVTSTDGASEAVTTTARASSVDKGPMYSLYSLMDYLNLSNVKVNPSYATRLQLKCQVMHERGPNWLKLQNENTGEAFLRRLRYDEPLKPMFEEYLKELKEKLRNAKEVPESEWSRSLQRIETLNNDLESELSKAEGGSSSQEEVGGVTPGKVRVEGVELKHLAETNNIVVKDKEGNRINTSVLIGN